jgi:hypothetical protein
MSETTRKNGRKAETKKKPHTACYFDSEGNKLFVPTESMWKLHAASTPAQITKRSNLSDYQWSNWKKGFRKRSLAFGLALSKVQPAGKCHSRLSQLAESVATGAS